MGKQGPCYHCGISTTPLWRNGPPDKPVLCNACGSRWRTKGTLANYMPMHSGGCGANESLDYKWPRGKKVSQKFKEQNLHKIKEPCDVHHEAEFGVPKSNQQYGKVIDEDGSTRSSSVSGISYSEGCIHYGGVLENYSSVAVQPSVWDPQVPSKKRTCRFRQRPSSLEKLTRSMQNISQEQESSSLSSSSEENMLYECKVPLVADEMGLGSVFVRQPRSSKVDEESEASSLLIEKKGYNTFDVLTQAYSGAMAGPVEIRTDNIVVPERWKEIAELSQEQSTKCIEHEEVLERLLQTFHSQLRSIKLKDVLNFDTFKGQLKEEEQRQLMKYLSSVDDSSSLESLECMFSSAQFEVALSNFQHLLSEGMFGAYGSKFSYQLCQFFQQLLVVTDLTNSKWMERYLDLQRYKPRGCCKFSKKLQSKEAAKPRDFCLIPSSISKSNKSGTCKAFTNFSGQLPGQVIAGSEICTKIPESLPRIGPKTVHPFTPPSSKSNSEGMYHDSIDTGSTSKEASGFAKGMTSSPYFGPDSLFASPQEKCSSFMLDSTGAFGDEVSDSVLLFNVPPNLSFPQAELLHSPVLKCNTSKDIVADANKFENENWWTHY
uniref:TSA: Wollemia nobilis Ref_Wollemi_Transcript_11123_2146 transcribed RNA sequence n=1 Tax=Wollemia nobilis TaxID=56998 RepID=A0A0C9RVD6_9CONI